MDGKSGGRANDAMQGICLSGGSGLMLRVKGWTALAIGPEDPGLASLVPYSHSLMDGCISNSPGLVAASIQLLAEK